MRWPSWSGKSEETPKDREERRQASLPAPTPHKAAISWNDSLNAIDWQHFRELRNWIPPLLVTATLLGFVSFYKSYLRRIPGTNHIQPSFFRRRSLFGQVTSVGDGDNFHLFHTPGGRLAGWGWLRKVPTDRKELKGRTVGPISPPSCTPRSLKRLTNCRSRYLSASPVSTPPRVLILGGRPNLMPPRPYPFYSRTS